MNPRSRFTSRGHSHGWISIGLLIVSLAMTPQTALTQPLPGDPPPGTGITTVWQQPTFMIGTEDGPCLIGSGPEHGPWDPTELDIARLQFAKDFGLTMTWLAFGDSQPFEKLFSQDYMLDAMSQVGLWTWVPGGAGPNPGWWTQPWSAAEETEASQITTEALNRAATNPGQRGAQLGYFIASEPGAAAETYVKNWVAHVHDHDPTKLGYIAIKGLGALEPSSVYTDLVNQWFNDPVAKKRPDVLAFDHYPFTRPDDLCAQNGMSKRYFENLAIAKYRALGRPVWTYIATQRWYSYIDVTGVCGGDDEQLRLRLAPTNEKLRFQLYCPLAYGVKGLFYWNYLQAPQEPGAEPLPGQGIMASCDVPNTAKFNELQANNRYIRDAVGPTVMNSAWIGAFHNANSTGELNLPSAYTVAEAPVIKETGSNGGSLLFGLFATSQNPQNGQHLLVVNKNWLATTGGPVQIVLRGNYSGMVEISPSPIGYTGTMTWTSITATYDAGLDQTSFDMPQLAGGEGRLLRLNKDGIAPDLSALQAVVNPTSLTFSWVVPGDDVRSNGPAGVSYEIRSSPATLVAANFASGTLVASGPLVSGGSTVSQVTVEVGAASNPRHYAIRFTDDVGNLSEVGANTPPIGTGGGGGTGHLDPATTLRFKLALAPPAPNPTSRNVAFRFSVPGDLAGAPLSLDVFDLSGRRVAGVLSGKASVGNAVANWDLQDRAGRPVAAGFYVVRLTVGDSRLQRPLMVK